MNKGLIILLAILAIILIIGSWLISGLNYVVKLDEAMSAAWGQVENQLQRRNDLVPNLVNTVKGYAAHEKGVFTEVTKYRSQWANATTRDDKIQAAQGLGAALSRLLLVAENYPQLKADQNFLSLQAQLEGTENRIAVERNRFNESVREFNTYIRSVFGSIFANIRRLSKAAQYFQAEEAAKAVPKVEF